MGSGKWSTSVYTEREKKRAASGASAFAYSDDAKRSGKLKAHPTLDPYAVHMRESRDSDEHPASNSIIVLFDVTGSMGSIPVALQKDLPQLLGLLLYKDYIPHPQILFGAVGDAHSDRVPLQVGQFESDNRMDEHLQNIVLEGGGGGQGYESYELGMYFAARHTSMDCWEKRRKKAYLFMIGDEKVYDVVNVQQVNQLIGAGLEQDIPLEAIITEVKEKYHLYFIVPSGAYHGGDQEYRFWTDLLGEQHVLRLDNPEDVAETIALVIGTCEGTIGLDDGVEHLRQAGAEESTIATVKKALATLPIAQSGGIVKGSAGSLSNLTPTDDSSGGTRRL